MLSDFYPVYSRGIRRKKYGTMIISNWFCSRGSADVSMMSEIILINFMGMGLTRLEVWS